jgi:Ca-activated chloride channel family protein
MNDHDSRHEATPDPAQLEEARLTAYALGDLDAADAAEVERRIAATPGLSAEVEAIRRFAADLDSALRAEPAPGLTSAQRAAIGAGAPLRERRLVFSSRTFWAGAGLIAAACVAIVLVAPLFSEAEKARENVAFGDREALEQRADAFAKNERAEEGQAPASRARREAGREVPSGSPVGGVTAADALSDSVQGLKKLEAELRDQPSLLLSTIEPNQSAWSDLGVADEHVARLRGAVPPSALAAEPAPGAADGRAAGSTSTTTGAPIDDDEADADMKRPDHSGESYSRIEENRFRDPIEDGADLPTFAVDVDTASYANLRRLLRGGNLPPPDAVRLEEMINYFDYAYAPPAGEHPFSVTIETSACPWNPGHRLMQIGLKGRDVPRDERPATNLVFLVDVSGSMSAANKLPLVQASLRLLVDNLIADDRIAIVVYAGASGLVLPSTYCDERGVILSAIENLRSGGSTNGGAGIELAYRVAEESFIQGGVNRVILCTDGDFNVGVTGDALIRLIEEKRRGGVELTVLGYGTGNVKDDAMEKLANHGNGNFGYIDSIDEAGKVLVDEMVGTLVTIAKDVKVQVEFNPAQVREYRLLGYENRVMAARDFRDDARDAGEIGAGHTVTALFEIVPGAADGDAAEAGADDRPLKYQRRRVDRVGSPDLATVYLRYKIPGASGADAATEIEFVARDAGAVIESASRDFQFAAAVAAFGMILRDSSHKGDATCELVRDLAAPGVADDAKGRRAEFVELVEIARSLGKK